MSNLNIPSFLLRLSACGVFLLAVGCSGPRPILYPNDHLKQVGTDQAEQDIEECKQLAEDYVPEHDASHSYVALFDSDPLLPRSALCLE